MESKSHKQARQARTARGVSALRFQGILGWDKTANLTDAQTLKHAGNLELQQFKDWKSTNTKLASPKFCTPFGTAIGSLPQCDSDFHEDWRGTSRRAAVSICCTYFSLWHVHVYTPVSVCAAVFAHASVHVRRDSCRFFLIMSAHINGVRSSVKAKSEIREK